MNAQKSHSYEGSPPCDIAELFGHWDAITDALRAVTDERVCNALVWAQSRIADDMADLVPRGPQEMAMQVIAMTSLGQVALPEHPDCEEFWDYAWALATGKALKPQGEHHA